MGLDPQNTLTEHDETRNVQNRVGIQIMELNPIRKEKAAKKRVRRKRKSSEEEGKKDYLEAWGSLGIIYRPAARVSTGSFFRMPIFSALDNSLSPIFVWTQLPMTEPLVSAVLALLAAALAAVELLCPWRRRAARALQEWKLRGRRRWSRTQERR
jgi:hypothetical protein